MPQPPAPVNPPNATEGWSVPCPEHIPRPTFAPVVIAASVMCIFWGFVTTILITLLGVVLFAIGIRIWLEELRYDV
jgi:hypothetical protein